MKYTKVAIHSFDYLEPDEFLTSDDIETKLAPVYKRLNLPAGRLELMTGIKSRGLWANGMRPSELSTRAAERVLEKSGINRNEIGLLIHASVCRDFLEPSTASVVHHNLELNEDAMIYDLSNACLGVVNAMAMASNMIELGQIKYALIVSGENGGPLLTQTIEHLNNDETLTRKSIKKYIANLTIGSAAVAYLLCDSSLAPDAPRILGGAVCTDSSANILCQGDGDTTSLMMETDSEELLKHGLELAKKNWTKTKQELSLENKDIDWVVGHQVGTAHETLTMKAMELQDHKTFTTYETLGNTGSSALPITLAKLSEKQKIKKGEKVALLGIGSGLTSIMLGVQW
ncbi:putative 3-oxoacyl-[acyl-carrier-protein] synthase III protein [Halobacteriovorax marinus SJ]|uniref:3-oxoacyl-[acyl-carrier-protein] synthase III protein n=1 Tax=Halobacteriovorax marinus (strain ATCC BAA-682 / DSM 15412 / SJ) TaxID=862908 RepID=E1X076_HALMS|nr:3-oxoacyl-ACP synthase III [Halobacteriovorax marinus]CBW26303.1 putative 3-oxoacyl-[acyl-carrier-protein] synthase III protein [Halobacteriovorax marinus SJ]